MARSLPSCHNCSTTLEDLRLLEDGHHYCLDCIWVVMVSCHSCHEVVKLGIAECHFCFLDGVWLCPDCVEPAWDEDDTDYHYDKYDNDSLFLDGERLWEMRRLHGEDN